MNWQMIILSNPTLQMTSGSKGVRSISGLESLRS